ncbi:serine threonine- kinase pim-2-like protein [Labeo rohita]|uniref:non-specific serine/threonine protein kinase n=1 Tax=Labeo rohita TaxID=84645 RepID=A0A498LJE6_LABRO|nr:serine threonine- kinase pim-2-like protein [Labeo rohita]RXN35451.1 serine threonine- kinase pim-2-like protein [Labeo rohita]
MSGQICDQHHHDQVKLIDFICSEIIKSGGYKGVFIGYACPPEYFVDFEYEAETTTVWSLGIVMYRTVCGQEGVNEGGFLLPDDTSIAALIPKNSSQVLSIFSEAVEQKTLLQAVDLCFKHFYMYDINYPKLLCTRL